MPAWLKFGTALRCVDHAVEAITSQAAAPETVELGLSGLKGVRNGILAMAAEGADSSAGDPEAEAAAAAAVYRGGMEAMRAFTLIGYGAGHFLENHFSARFGLHQGACSSMLMWRMLHHHRHASAGAQAQIVETLAAGDAAEAQKSAARLIFELCAATPGMPTKFPETIDGRELTMFAKYMFGDHVDTLNRLCPEDFYSTEDVLALLQTEPELL